MTSYKKQIDYIIQDNTILFDISVCISFHWLTGKIYINILVIFKGSLYERRVVNYG